MSYGLLATYNQRRGIEIPPVTPAAPNTISNLTAWMDFTDSSRLFGNTGGTTAITSTHQIVRRVNNRTGGPHWNYGNGVDSLWQPNYFGSGRGGVRMRFLTGTGTTRFLPSSSPTLEYFVNNNAQTYFFVGRIFCRGGHDIITLYDEAFYVRMGATASSLKGDNYDTDYRGVNLTHDPAVFVAVVFRHNGTTWEMRTSSSSWIQVACGSTGSTGGNFVAGLYGSSGDVTLGHIATYDRALSDGEVASLLAWGDDQDGTPAYVEELPTAFTQSAVYDPSIVATTTNMRDGDRTTGCGAGNGSGTAWIKADLGSSKTISMIRVEGGILGGGWGGVSPYLIGANVQRSTNDSTWVTVASAIINDIYDDGTNTIKEIPFVPGAGRWWRITLANWISTSRFQLYS